CATWDDSLSGDLF
nr:immunoglobulin light chain junction region [Macaca mulatta]